MVTTHVSSADVRTILGEANPAVRTGIQAALHGRGIRGVVTCRDQASLVEELNDAIVDLLIWDVGIAGADLCWIVQQIRQGNLGKNPFVIVVATVNDTSLPVVRGLINAGVDGVLGKPMPMSMVIDQISQLLESRRPFVATDDYVGPSRRSARRPDDSADQLMRAPNSLRSKLVERVDERRVQQLIGLGMSRVRELQAQSTPLAIARNIDRVGGFFRGEGSAAELHRDLDRIVAMSNEMMRRHHGTRSEHLAALANTVLNLALRVGQEPTAANRTYARLLAELGRVVRRATRIEEDSVQMLEEITETVARFTQAWVGLAS